VPVEGVEDELVVGERELEAALEELPQAAAVKQAQISTSAVSRRAFIGRTVPGVGNVRRVSESAASFGLPMTTALELPGMRIRENLGVCYGLVVRSMGFTGGVTASFRALRRGEIPEYTQLLEDSRRHAIDRMVDNARLIGAEAIVAVRFDSSEIGQQFTEIVAYGTAVKVDRVG
jgi:uncharacterized protein YbjQ (UPF0145 family)